MWVRWYERARNCTKNKEVSQFVDRPSELESVDTNRKGVGLFHSSGHPVVPRLTIGFHQKARTFITFLVFPPAYYQSLDLIDHAVPGLVLSRLTPRPFFLPSPNRRPCRRLPPRTKNRKATLPLLPPRPWVVRRVLQRLLPTPLLPRR